MTSAPRLSIIVPCLDEAQHIEAALARLALARHRGAEVIVVDGGSVDGTAQLARAGADCVLSAPRSRAIQMNAGAGHARAPALLFLHADTRLPERADDLIVRGLACYAWGRFDVAIEGAHPMLRVIAAAMNARSRLTGIATGDQALFVRRSTFERLGRFAEIDLMEDVELTKRLKRVAPPLCLRERVTTSGRRWEKHGVLRTIFLMWRLRFAYWRGADPARLASRYVAHSS